MKRFAIPLLLAAACSGKVKPASTSGAGSGSARALYAKKLSLGWGIQDHGATSADVFLQTTDETGAQKCPKSNHSRAQNLFTILKRTMPLYDFD